MNFTNLRGKMNWFTQMHIRTLSFLVLALVVSPAQANELPKEFRHSVMLNSGFASAVGLGGVTYRYWFLPFIGVEGGVGFGLTGIQFSTMGSVRLGNRNIAYVGGVGFAVSHALDNPGGDDAQDVLWLNADLAGCEFRADNGLTIALTVGWTDQLTSREQCPEEDSNSYENICLLFQDGPQGRIGFGYSF